MASLRYRTFREIIANALFDGYSFNSVAKVASAADRGLQVDGVPSNVKVETQKALGYRQGFHRLILHCSQQGKKKILKFNFL